MMVTVEELLGAAVQRGGDEGPALDAMERLVNIASASPRYFRGQTAPLISVRSARARTRVRSEHNVCASAAR